MESTTENIAEMENTKTEQSTDKENETIEQIQDNVKETTNENPGETVEEEEAHVNENRDSSCPMVIEEVIPTNDDEPTKDDLPKIDNEVTNDDKNSQLEKSTHLSPPSEALHPEEGLINPTVEDIVEKDTGSSQVSSDTLKNEGDSVEVDKDTPVENDETVAIPDIKTSEDKESLHYDGETVIEQEKPQEEHDMISSGNHNKVSTSPDTKVVEEKSEKIDEGEGNNTNLTDNGTTMDLDKEPEVPVSEIVPKLEDTPSEPLIETSMDIEKEPHVPAAEDITENEKRSDVSAAVIPESGDKAVSVFPATQTSSDHDEPITTLEAEPAKDAQLDAATTTEKKDNSKLVTDASFNSTNVDVSVEAATTTVKKDNSRTPEINDVNTESASMGIESGPSNVKIEVGAIGDTNNGAHNIDSTLHAFNGTMSGAKHSFLLDDISDGNDSGTEEDQSAFMKELDNFFRERNMEFKPPKFYGEGLNCLKLFRAVTRLGGYDKVTGSKLWRQVGESFRPPKTCTTVSWTFRGFYEKALLEYERHKVNGGELQIPLASEPDQMNIDNQASGSGRARRDAAARAMQGWHSQRHGNGEFSDPTNKDKNSVPQLKREKQIVAPGLLKRKRPSSAEHGAKTTTQMSKPMLDVTVVDVGQPADWVKINVQRTQDCFEVYALVPGLVREEVRVQSDPAGRLVISGEPENPLNPWGATPFKKVVSLPARIDPHHTSAVVTLNGQLFVRVPLEQSD